MKKAPAPERDHREVEVDPQPEREAVVHVRLVEPEREAQVRGVDAEPEQRHPWREPEQEASGTGRGAGRAATSRSSMVPPVGGRAGRGAVRQPPHPVALRVVVDLRRPCPAAPAAGRSRARARAAPTSLAGSSRSPKRIAAAGQASTQAGAYSAGVFAVRSGGGLPVARLLQPVAAEAALLDDAARARRDLRVQRLAEPARPVGVPPVERARVVRAGGHAVAAAQAAHRDLRDDARARDRPRPRSAGRPTRRGSCRRTAGTSAARTPRAPRPAPSTRCTRSQLMPVRSLARSAAGGTLFSTAQAMLQAPQPLQRSRSITIP